MAETKVKKTKKKSLFEGMPTVKIKIPITREEKDDVWVSVNGKSMQIKRGQEVEVPECIAEVLQHQEEMIIKSLENEAEVQAKATAEELN